MFNEARLFQNKIIIGLDNSPSHILWIKPFNAIDSHHFVNHWVHRIGAVIVVFIEVVVVVFVVGDGVRVVVGGGAGIDDLLSWRVWKFIDDDANVAVT